MEYQGGYFVREQPVEPVMGAQNNREANMQELREMQERKVEVPVRSEEEKEEIRRQLRAEIEKMNRMLEWGKQQANTVGVDNLKAFEQDFDKLYDQEITRLAQLKRSNYPYFDMELLMSVRKLSALTDRIPNLRAQLESDVEREVARSR